MALSNLIALLLSATFKQTGLIVFLLSIDFLRSFPLAKEQLVRIGRYHSGGYLHNVRIPTLSANSRIVLDDSRIAQGVSYRFFCYNQALSK